MPSAESVPASASPSASHPNSDELVNASGHRQEVERNFSLISICAVAITTGNTWIAQGGSITTALLNGGPAGVIYEFMAVSVCYWLVAASIAELASGMPSASGGMYTNLSASTVANQRQSITGHPSLQGSMVACAVSSLDSGTVLPGSSARLPCQPFSDSKPYPCTRLCIPASSHSRGMSSSVSSFAPGCAVASYSS